MARPGLPRVLPRVVKYPSLLRSLESRKISWQSQSRACVKEVVASCFMGKLRLHSLWRLLETSVRSRERAGPSSHSQTFRLRLVQGGIFQL